MHLDLVVLCQCWDLVNRCSNYPGCLHVCMIAWNQVNTCSCTIFSTKVSNLSFWKNFNNNYELTVSPVLLSSRGITCRHRNQWSIYTIQWASEQPKWATHIHVASYTARHYRSDITTYKRSVSPYRRLSWALIFLVCAFGRRVPLGGSAAQDQAQMSKGEN